MTKDINGMVHPKKNILSFTDPRVVPSMHDFFCWTQKMIFWINIGKQAVAGSHSFPYYEKKLKGMSTGNHFIFGWTISLSLVFWEMLN